MRLRRLLLETVFGEMEMVNQNAHRAENKNAPSLSTLPL